MIWECISALGQVFIVMGILLCCCESESMRAAPDSDSDSDSELGGFASEDHIE